MAESVLEFLREQDPRLKEVPDRDLTLLAAKEHPELLKDPEFNQAYALAKLPEVTADAKAAQPPISPAEEEAKLREEVMWHNARGADLARRASALQAEARQAEMVPQSLNPQPFEQFDRERQEYLAQSQELAKKLDAWEARSQPSLESRSWLRAKVDEFKERLGSLFGSEDRRYRLGPAASKVERYGFFPALGAANAAMLEHGGRMAAAVAADVANIPAAIAGYTKPAENATALDEGRPLPAEERVEQSTGLARLAGKAGLALPKLIPLAAEAGAAAGLGAPEAVAMGGPFLYNEEGQMRPLEAAGMAALPAVSRAGEALTAEWLAKAPPTKVVIDVVKGRGEGGAVVADTLRGKVTQRLPGGLELTQDGYRKLMEMGGGQLAANAYLSAMRAPEIAALPPEQRGQAVLDTIAENLAMSLAGLSPRPGISRTLDRMAGELIARARRTDWHGKPERPASPPPEEIAGPQPEQPPSPPPGQPSGRPPTETEKPTIPATEQPSGRPPTETEKPAWTVDDQGIIWGEPTVISGAKRSQYQARYALVPFDQVYNSFNDAWEDRPEFAPLKNTRNYRDNFSEREKVVDGANSWDPWEYVTDARSAAVGPLIVARKGEGQKILITAGGNGRKGMLDRMLPDKWAHQLEVQSQRAGRFGLPEQLPDDPRIRRDTPYLLVRMLDAPLKLDTPEGLKAAQELVDLLNPSPGQAEGTAVKAWNDAAKVPLDRFRNISVSASPLRKRGFLEELLTDGLVDRSTRVALLESEDETDAYVSRLLLNAAFNNQLVTAMRFAPDTEATLVSLVDSATPMMIELRARGGEGDPITRVFNHLFQRVIEFRKLHPLWSIDRVLQWVADQNELAGDEEFAAARNLARLLASRVETTTAGGKSRVDFYGTKDNWKELLDSLAKTIRLNKQDAGGDIFGQKTSLLQAVQDWLKFKLGPSADEGKQTPEARLSEEPERYAGRAQIGPTPEEYARLDKRLRALRRKGERGPLTQDEVREIEQIERALGQSFMAFYGRMTDEEARQAAEQQRQRQRQEIERLQKRRLTAGPLETQKTLFPEAGQLSLFESGPRLREDPEEYARLDKRLRELRRKGERGPLTQDEVREIEQIERVLRQEAERQRQREKIEMLQKRRLVAGPLETQKTLFPEAGQLSLFEPGAQYDVDNAAGPALVRSLQAREVEEWQRGARGELDRALAEGDWAKARGIQAAFLALEDHWHEPDWYQRCLRIVAAAQYDLRSARAAVEQGWPGAGLWRAQVQRMLEQKTAVMMRLLEKVVPADTLARMMADQAALGDREEWVEPTVPLAQRLEAIMHGADRLRVEALVAPSALRRATAELAAGRQVVIYAHRENGAAVAPGALLALADRLRRNYPDQVELLVARPDEDVHAQRHTQQARARFARGEARVLIGTRSHDGTGIRPEGLAGRDPVTVIELAPADGGPQETPWPKEWRVVRLHLSPLGAKVQENEQTPEESQKAVRLAAEAEAYNLPARAGAPGALPGRELFGQAGQGAGGVHRGVSAVSFGRRVQVLAQLARAELINTGELKLAGKYVGDPAAAAAVFCAALRNPLYEVQNYVLIRKGKIVGPIISLTAKLPMAAPASLPDESTMILLGDLARKYKADGWYSVHNHPSGHPQPSSADIAIDKYFRSWSEGRSFLTTAEGDDIPSVPGYKGMIVTDHDKAARIDPSLSLKFELIEIPNAGPDPLRQPASDAPEVLRKELVNRRRMKTWEDAAKSGARVFDPEQLGVLVLSTQNEVIGMLSMPWGRNADALAEELKDAARRTGASVLIGFYNGVRTNQAVELFRELHNLKIFYDGIVAVGSGYMNLFSLDPRLQEWDRRNYYLGENIEKLGPITKEWLREAEERYAYDHPPVHSTPALVWEKPSDPTSPYNPEAPMGTIAEAPGVVQVELGGMQYVRPLEMPELVRLAKELTGEVPMVRRLPKSRGAFRPEGAGHIKLDPRIFRSWEDAAKTLAHEAGHLVDYLPDRTMARGNLFGRLGALLQFLKHTFPKFNTTPMSQVLTPQDRSRIRRAAEKQVGPRPPKDEEADLAMWRSEVARVYREMVEEEIDRRKLVKLDELMDEVLALVDFWKPIPDGAPQAYREYRNSSAELYADLLSVLLNSPGLLAERAPLFYSMFFEYLDRKPPVKRALFELWDLIHHGKVGVLDKRRQEIAAAYLKGEEILRAKAAEQAARRHDWRAYWRAIKIAFLDQNEALLEKAEALERQGIVLPADQDPRVFMDELSLGENRVSRWLQRMFEHVVKPVEDFGMSVVDLGEYLYYNRVLGDRKELANPGGHNPRTAREGLLRMRLALGLDRMTILEAASRRFHELSFEVVEEAVAVGSYNRKVFEDVLLPNKYTYATFIPLDYLDDHVPATIKKQIGSLKDVANPFTATVLKMVTLHNLNAIQKAKRGWIRLALRYFPEEIQPAEMVWDGAKRVSKRPPEGKADLVVLEDGKPTTYWVDPAVAEAFERSAPGDLVRALEPMDQVFRAIFYPLWITYSAGFQVANVRRDWSRTRRNLGAGRLALAANYARVLGAAIRRMRGQPDKLVQEMAHHFAIGLPDTDFMQDFGLSEREDFLLPLLRRYGILPEAPEPGQLRQLAHKVGAPLRLVGNIIETLPKLAGYRWLRLQGKNPREAAAIVRNYVGTPNVRRRGKLVKVPRALVPFWNVFAQGWRADARLMTNPKTAGGWWLRWGIRDGMWAVIQGLAAAGVLGETLKELMDGVSEYYKTNTAVLPLGQISGGDFGKETVFVALPRDETSRLLSGLTYKMTRLAVDGKLDHVEQVMAFGAGQLPGWTPLITVSSGWWDYVRGRNPDDPLTGKPIIPRTEWDAGGRHKAEVMTLWSYNQTGLQDYFRLSDYARATTELQAALAFAPGVNRYIKVSDYGYREAQAAGDEAEAAARAVHRLNLPADTRAVLSEFWRLSRQHERTPQQELRYQALRMWHSQVFKPLDERLSGAEAIEDGKLADDIRRQMSGTVQALKR